MLGAVAVAIAFAGPGSAARNIAAFVGALLHASVWHASGNAALAQRGRARCRARKQRLAYVHSPGVERCEGQDPHALSTIERAEMRRQADLAGARQRSATFSLLQPLCGLAAAAVLGFALWAYGLYGDATPRAVWISAYVVSGCSLDAALLRRGRLLRSARPPQLCFFV